MNKLKLFWKNYPSVTSILDTHKMTPSIIGMLMVPVIIYALPRLLNQTLLVAMIATTISYVASIGFFLFLIKDSKSKFVTTVFTITSIINVIWIVLLFLPSTTFTLHSNDGLKPNTTYVAYSPTCKYCQKSKSNMERAVNVYNASHRDQVYLINLDKDTKSTNEITPYLKYKGTIANITNDKFIVYTTGNDSKPTTNTANNIYNMLQAARKSTK